MTNEQMRVELPRLPEPFAKNGYAKLVYYTADQTQAYATAAILADRERRADDHPPSRHCGCAECARVSGAVLTDEQILSCLDGRQPVCAHHGAAVFEYRLFALVDFARRVLALAATQQAEPSAGSGPWHRLVKVPLNLTEPPVYKDRWVPCMSDAPGAEPMPAFVQELRKLPDLSEEDVQVLIAMVHAGHDYAANLASKEATPSAASPELIAAARAVVARWHSPKWKDEAPTAEFIQRLERALPPSAADRLHQEGNKS